MNQRIAMTVAVAALPLALALGGCNRSQAAQAAAQGYAGAAAPKAALVTVPPRQMGHVQVVRAAAATWPRQLRLTGSVDYNQFATTPVLSQVSGPVARIMVEPGDEVRAGQTLLEIASPDFAQDRGVYLKARDARALAQKTLRRDQDLYEHHAIPEADLQAAESAETQADADLQTAEQSLRILGFPNPAAAVKATPNALIPLKAPIAGEVVERNIAPGQLVQANGTQCFVISNMSTVWVMANVYQNDLAYVRVGDPVTITTDAYPQAFFGRIQYLSPALDPTTRTLQARIETRNPGGALKKQMYVTALVTAGELRHIVVVPNAAILRDSDNFPFVYVQAGAPNQFARRQVSIGASRGGFTQVASGLAAGVPVVANGSLFLQFASSFQ
jgi:cobalt-zinc-cadmium efflux system membrane fusion protein